MAQRLSEYRLFLREFVRNFHTTGAVLPSGRWLAAALARYVGNGLGPKRILEVGPGTGAVTQKIVAALGNEDYLDLVELNDSFVHQLRERFRSDPGFQPVAERARVLHCAVQELPPEASYDLIISGLPQFRSVVSGRRDRERLRGIGKVLDGVLQGNEIRRDWIWPNVPPAWVHHVRLSGATVTAPEA